MEWWVFPALVLCAVTFTAAAGVLVFLAARGVWRLLARYEPAHAAGRVDDPDWTCFYCHHQPDDPRYDDGTPVACDCSCHAVEQWVPWDTDPRFGSMQLDADRAYQERVTWAMDAWQPPTVPPHDWREVAHEEDWRAQTLHDLAPAVLDSGPGFTSLAPGPDLAGVDSHVRTAAMEAGWLASPTVVGVEGLESLPSPATPEPEPEPERTVAGRLVESSEEWLRRLMEAAGPGWTYAGVAA